MCKSISLIADVSELTGQFEIDQVLAYRSNRYEISPTESVPAVVVRDNKRQLDEFRWGFMPFWAKDSVWLDSHTLPDKRIYRHILKKQRCVIPCSGFYVTQTDDKNTQWIKLTMPAGTFAIAALFDVWRSSYDDQELRTCTMLMTKANSLVAPYQDQMPAIMDQEEVDQWLQPELKDPFILKSLLRPMDELRMRAYILTSPKDKYEPEPNLDIPRPELA